MIKSIILASRSKVRKKILEENNIKCEIIPSNIDEDSIKESLIKEKAIPEIISKNLAELKANKISEKKPNELVLGADSVIDLNGKLISKPTNRDEAFNILQKLNGQKHRLKDKELYAYNVYQIEDEGRSLFSKIEGDENTIMGLPIKQIKEYLIKYE